MGLAIVSSVLNKLSDFAIQEALLLHGLQDQVESLRRELQAIACFLKDADSRQKHDERAKNWVREIREVTYDAEDIIDTFMLEIDKHGPKPRLLSGHSIAKKIERINTRIRELATHKSTYSIGDVAGPSSSSNHGLLMWRRLSPHLGDDKIIGFHQDARVILDRLLDTQRQRSVISIVGMGGIGKTTLATKVFKEASLAQYGGHLEERLRKRFDYDSSVKRHFDICIWASLTQEPDINNLLIGVLKEVLKAKYRRAYEHYFNTIELGEELFRLLNGIRYFVVIDDVWREDTWDLMKQYFPNNDNGSRIVLTTRSITIATKADSTSSPYHLQPLPDVESRELFLRKVFQSSIHDGNPILPEELEDLGWQLSRKCCGLPLALVVLGGFLSGKAQHPSVWLNLLKSMSWESTEAGKQCLDILAISYNDLPYHMKYCFLYAGIFPQGSEISASKLIKLWTAEQLITQVDTKMMEETAEDYLEELIQRCLVQAVKRGSDDRVNKIRLHDLLRELAISEARECRFFHVKDSSTLISMPREQKEVHRLSLLLSNVSQPSFTLESSEKLRALLLFQKGRSPLRRDAMRFLLKPAEKSEKSSWIQLAKSYLRLANPPAHPHSIISYKSSSAIEFMRVLDLEGAWGLDSLPEEIKKMVHLKHLGLRNTDMKELPSAITKLQLQTLDIRSTRITQLPEEFGKLRTIRHLYLNESCTPKVDDFTNLQTLHQAADGDWIGRDLPRMTNLRKQATDGDWIGRDLPRMTNLRKLRIKQVIIPHDGYALPDSLRQLSQLTSLRLNVLIISSDIITAVSIHQTLQKLELKGKFSSNKLPSGNEFPRYLTKLTLHNSRLEEDPMPELEMLLSLRILKLQVESYVGREMTCSVYGFRKLRYLEFDYLQRLMYWQLEEGGMPNLVHLVIKSCNSLAMLPSGLKYITTLQQVELTNLVRISEWINEEWDKIQHVPTITHIPYGRYT